MIAAAAVFAGSIRDTELARGPERCRATTPGASARGGCTAQGADAERKGRAGRRGREARREQHEWRERGASVTIDRLPVRLDCEASSVRRMHNPPAAEIL
ncbi:hypothetical protein GCM10009748_31460 [Agromyces lapidis]